MPRTKKPVKTEQFSIRLPRQAVQMLMDLIPIGLHGSNRSEVAKSLILTRLEQLMQAGIVERPSSDIPADPDVMK